MNEQKQYYITSESYAQLKAAWKKLADAQCILAPDILIYNLLRGKSASNGFCATANSCKIQGNDPWHSFKEAKRYAMFNCPSGRLDSEAFKNRANSFFKRFGIAFPHDLDELIKACNHE